MIGPGIKLDPQTEIRILTDLNDRYRQALSDIADLARHGLSQNNRSDPNANGSPDPTNALHAILRRVKATGGAT